MSLWMSGYVTKSSFSFHWMSVILYLKGLYSVDIRQLKIIADTVLHCLLQSRILLKVIRHHSPQQCSTIYTSVGIIAV